MKQESVEKYVSLMQIETSKNSFVDDYKKSKDLLTSLCENCTDFCGFGFFDIEEKWRERWMLCWKDTFKLEYNRALLAFEGSKCPIDAYIYHCCYIRLPTIFLEKDDESFSRDCKVDEVEIRHLKKRYGFDGENALAYFHRLFWITSFDYWEKSKVNESKGVIDYCLAFKYEEYKKIFVETMIELCDLFQKQYSQYLPESFLTACAKDKEVLLLVQKSLQD